MVNNHSLRTPAASSARWRFHRRAYSFIAWRSFERSFCSCDISNMRFGAFSAFQRHHFAIFDAAVCIVRSARARIIASAIGAARAASAAATRHLRPRIASTRRAARAASTASLPYLASRAATADRIASTR